MRQFSLRNLVLLLTVLALAIALFKSQYELGKAKTELVTLRNQMRYLSGDNNTDIHVINVPALNPREWRWRIDLPEKGKYQLRVAFDQIPLSGLPAPRPQTIFFGELPKEEFMFSVGIHQVDGDWKMNWRTDAADANDRNWQITIDSQNTEWLAKSGGTSLQIAGNKATESGSPDAPFPLLRYRQALKVNPTTIAQDPNPANGILIWIEPMAE